MLEQDGDGQESCSRSQLMEFLNQEMSLPFQVHSIHRQLFQAVKKNIAATASLCEMLELFNQVLSQSIYPKWIGFAADCAEMYVARGGHFVEKSDQVWNSAEILQQFMSLRLKYLQSFLNHELNPATSSKKLQVLPMVKAYLALFTAEDDAGMIQQLSAMDLVIPCDSWATVWSDSLCKANTSTELVEILSKHLKIDTNQFIKKMDIGMKSETKDSKDKNNGNDKLSKREDDDAKATAEAEASQFSLKETFFYKESKSELMQDSNHAKQLGLTSLSTVDIMSLKSQLEHIMWSAFADGMEKSKAGDWLTANCQCSRHLNLYVLLCFCL
eukprot:s1212_g5.t1